MFCLGLGHCGSSLSREAQAFFSSNQARDVISPKIPGCAPKGRFPGGHVRNTLPSRFPGGIIATSAGYFQCGRVAALVWSTLKTELFTLFLMKDPDTLQSHSFTSDHGLDLSVTASCSHPVWITTDLFNVEHCRNPLAAREVNATDYLNSFL